MNHHDFAEFFERNGSKIVKTASSYWYEIKPFCYQNIPYHVNIVPMDAEINYLFYNKMALLVRYNSINQNNSNLGFIWLLNNKNYHLDFLSANTRSKIRRGFKKTSVHKIDFHLLSKEGYSLVKETAVRQGRRADFHSEKAWVNFCKAAESISDFEAWGSFFSGNLATFLVGALIDDYFYYLELGSKSNLLQYYPNNALIYHVTKTKLSDPSVEIISYGLDSVEHTPGLKDFKKSMGFKLEQINFKILLNPLVSKLTNKKTIHVLNKLSALFPQNNYLRKAYSILKYKIESNYNL